MQPPEDEEPPPWFRPAVIAGIFVAVALGALALAGE